ANLLVTPWPRRRTVTFDAFRPAGRLIATSASPPEITSARLDRTSMRGPGCWAFASELADVTAPIASAATVSAAVPTLRRRCTCGTVAPRACRPRHCRDGLTRPLPDRSRRGLLHDGGPQLVDRLRHARG